MSAIHPEEFFIRTLEYIKHSVGECSVEEEFSQGGPALLLFYNQTTVIELHASKRVFEECKLPKTQVLEGQ